MLRSALEEQNLPATEHRITQILYIYIYNAHLFYGNLYAQKLDGIKLKNPTIHFSP